ncbi:MAG: AMP-binding protein, partial [Clostridia bacterium]
MYNDALKIAERIKYLREVFSLSQEALAETVNIPLEQYKDAEDGKFDFTFSFLQKLSKYYSVDIVELISGGTPKLSEFQIVRSGEGMPLERRKGFKYLHLASLFKEKAAEPFIVTARYDENEHKQPIALSTHNDQEFNIVIEGSLKFRIQDHITVLNAGDSVYYNAAIPHGMIAEGGDCKFLSLVIKSGKEAAPVTVTSGIHTYKEQNALYRNFVTPKLDEDGRLLSLDFHPEDNFNFAYDVVDAIAKKSPNKTAMLWVSAEKEEKLFTFSDIKEQSDKCANFFTSLGIKKGDRVMLVLKRYHQFWTAVLALHKIGAVAVPATHLLAKNDFEYRFNAAGISAVVITSDGNATSECELAIASSATVKTKIICGAPRKGWLDFDSGVAAASPCFAR